MCDCCQFIASRGGGPDDQGLIAEYDRLKRVRIRALIAQNSWLVIAVDGWPTLAYTTGLWSKGHAELCVFGLEPRVAQTMLNSLGDAIVHGASYADGDEMTAAGLPLRAFWLPNAGDIVFEANDFYRRKPRNSVPALQVVYPDAHDVWPWEPGCHQLPGQQPLPGTFAA